MTSSLVIDRLLSNWKKWSFAPKKRPMLSSWIHFHHGSYKNVERCIRSSRNRWKRHSIAWSPRLPSRSRPVKQIMKPTLTSSSTIGSARTKAFRSTGTSKSNHIQRRGGQSAPSAANIDVTTWSFEVVGPVESPDSKFKPRSRAMSTSRVLTSTLNFLIYHPRAIRWVKLTIRWK